MFGYKNWQGVNENLENLKKLQEKLTEAQNLVDSVNFENNYLLNDIKRRANIIFYRNDQKQSQKSYRQRRTGK